MTKQEIYSLNDFCAIHNLCFTDELCKKAQQEKQEILKAFVEWLKDNYGIKYGNARALYNRINKEDKYQRGYYSGKATALLDFMNELDKVLENFLKERENERLQIERGKSDL